jgi:hypothetical protein
MERRAVKDLALAYEVRHGLGPGASLTLSMTESMFVVCP